MFWGLALENGKRYAKTVETPFRITHAVLDTTTADDDIIRVMVDVDDCETLLCNLSLKHGILQCPLDLQFLDGEQIALYAYGGKGQVYLSGYLMSEEGEGSMFGDEEEDEDVAEEEEVSSDEDVPELVAPSTSGKRKPDSIANPIPVKKSKVHQDVEAVQPTKVTVCEMSENGVKGLEDDDEDEDDEDYEIEEEEGSDEEGEEEEESDDDEEMEDEEVEEEDDGDKEMEDDTNKTPKAEVKTPKAEVKTPKAEVKTPKAEAKTPKAEAKTPKAEAKTPKAEAKTPKAEAKTPKAEAKTPKAEAKTPKAEIEEKKDDTEKAGSELDNSLSETTTPKKEKKKKKKELLAINGETPQTPKQKTEEKQKQDDAPKTPKQKNIISTPGKLDKTPKSQVKVEAAASPIVSKAGGVICEDLVVGTGQEAKNGRMVSVYYEGRLKSNNKMFDSTLKGPPFKFRLGGGEVIKGWDVGVNGMKIGGKRRVVCPPHMAYGKRGAPPDIPKNATLTFTIELKGV